MKREVLKPIAFALGLAGVLFSTAWNCTSAAEPSSFTSLMTKMIDSPDSKTRLTAYGLTTELDGHPFEKNLLEQYRRTSDPAEKAAIACALYQRNHDHLKLCLDAIPQSEAEIKKLLRNDSPEGSYLASPRLHFVTALSMAASWSGPEALAHLKRLSVHADGWQAESLGSLISEAEKKNRK